MRSQEPRKPERDDREIEPRGAIPADLPDIDAVDEWGEESFPASDPPQGPARIWGGSAGPEADR